MPAPYRALVPLVQQCFAPPTSMARAAAAHQQLQMATDKKAAGEAATRQPLSMASMATEIPIVAACALDLDQHGIAA